MALSKLTDIRKSLSVEVEDLQVNGITTFTGSVSIGGTLTYQDVTNVDSVGIITAQAGINVSGGQLDVGSNIKIGNAGIITATELDISGDIDVDGHTNLDNVNIAGVTTSTGNIYADNYFGNSGLTLNNNGNPSVNLTSTSTSGSSRIFFGDPGNSLVGRLVYSHNGDYMSFYTAGSEKVRITSTGNIGINQTSPERYLHITGNDGATGATLGNSDTLLVLDNLGTNGPIIEFASATNGAGRIQFTDTDAANRGRIEYLHSDDSMRMHTAGTERFRINSSGQLMLGTTTPGAAQVDTFTLETSGHTGMTLFSGTSSRGTIAFGDGRSGNAQYRGVILYEHSNDSMRFATADTTQMNISSNGHITKTNQPSFAAYRNVSDYVVNAGAKFEFNTTRHNVGNHYSTSNHRFTAPVAGSYQINFYTIFRGNVSSAYVRLYKNGARMYGGDIHFTHTSLGSNWDNVDFSQVVYLSASDYVEIYNGNSGNITYHGNHWQLFSGWLLG